MQVLYGLAGVSLRQTEEWPLVPCKKVVSISEISNTKVQQPIYMRQKSQHVVSHKKRDESSLFTKTFFIIVSLIQAQTTEKFSNCLKEHSYQL